jgi:hypothetical protein
VEIASTEQEDIGAGNERLKSIGKAKPGVCTNYSPGGYKKPAKQQPEKDKE